MLCNGKYIVVLKVLLLLPIAFCSIIPDSLKDLQTEFYLPYSVSEDVDFSISRPEGYGCFTWSVDSKFSDLVRLDPHVTNYEFNCGNNLLFKVLPQWADTSVDVVITGTNVRPETKSNRDTNTEAKSETGVPMLVKYTIHIREVKRLEVLALNTDMLSGSPPEPFGLTGYDNDGNEFDTLDGLQISWYIGSKRMIAEFEYYQQRGPTTKVRPTGAGKGAVIAVITDENYKTLGPGIRKISVKAPLEFEPANLVLLQHGRVHIKVFELITQANATVSRGQVVVGNTEKDEFTLEVTNPDIIRIDGYASGGCQVTALKHGNTDIFIKNIADGEIMKRHHIAVSSAAYSNIKASNPRHNRINQRQLTKGDVYDIEAELYTNDGRKIFPSENIISDMFAPYELSATEFTENRLKVKVQVKGLGLWNVSNILTSINGDNEKTYEIIPKVRSNVTFEVYDGITFYPKERILPWDKNADISYSLQYKTTGGDDIYAYNISNNELATADKEGIVRTHGGPGTFKVTAYMPKNPDDNNDDAIVYILPPERIDFNPNNIVEFPTSADITLTLKMMASLNANETAMFTNCHDVPYEILLSDDDNFSAVKETGRTQLHRKDGRRIMEERRENVHCTDFKVKQKTERRGLLCEVGIKYVEPSTGQVLRARKVISTFDYLTVMHPKPKNSKQGLLVLPVGSSSDIVMRGGPLPWKKLFGKNTNHFKKVEVNEVQSKLQLDKPFTVLRNKVASGDDIEENLVDDDKTINDLHVYTVTCLSEGSGVIRLTVGNDPDPNEKWTPMTSTAEVNVICSLPSMLNVITVGDGIVRDKHGKLFADNTKDIKLLLTTKDKSGNTFETIESLQFDVVVSDKSLIDESKSDAHFIIPKIQFQEYNDVKLPGKPSHTLIPTGKDGTLEITVKLAGYNKDELDKHEIKNPPMLPKSIDDEDVEEDENDYTDEYHEITKYLNINLASPVRINELKTE